jgi:hypothetical protein
MDESYKTMILIKYLIINHRGAIAIRERPPRLSSNEIAVKLELDLPNALFERPTLLARMKIPTEAVPKTKLTPAITDNVEKLIREATGLEMRITLVEAVETDSDKS